MRLEIKKDYDQSFVKDTVMLATHMLTIKATHLFIASNSWDSIRIELDENVPAEMIKSLKPICNDIKVKLPEKSDEHILAILVELCPDKAGLLRRTYMKGGNLREVIWDVAWSD